MELIIVLERKQSAAGYKLTARSAEVLEPTSYLATTISRSGQRWKQNKCKKIIERSFLLLQQPHMAILYVCIFINS